MCDTNGIGTMHICVLFRHQAKCNREDCMGQCYIALHASYTCSNRSLRESFGCIDRDQINRFNAMSWLTNVTFSERFACEIWYKTLNATDVTTFCFACTKVNPDLCNCFPYPSLLTKILPVTNVEMQRYTRSLETTIVTLIFPPIPDRP